MEENLRDILISYKHKINNIINKLEQFGGRNKIDDVKDKIKDFSDLLVKAKKTQTDMTTFNRQIDSLISKIHTTAETEVGDLGVIKIKLKRFKDELQKFMSDKDLEYIEDSNGNGYSLYSIAKTNELVGMFNTLLLAYKIIVKDSADIQFNDNDLKKYTSGITIYTLLMKKLNSKIDENAEQSENLINEIKRRIEKIKREILPIKDNFNEDDVKLIDGTINYDTYEITLRNGEVKKTLIEITINDRKLIKILPCNLKILLEISSQLLSSTFKSNNVYNLDTKYENYETTFGYGVDDLVKIEREIVGGGDYTKEISIFREKIFSLYVKINECHDLLDKMIDLTFDYQLTMERNYNHLSFLLLSLSEPYKSYGQKISLLKFINKDLIVILGSEMEKLKARIDNNENNKIIKYFSRYHYVTIDNLLIFLRSLGNVLEEPQNKDKCIDIDNCTGTIRNYFYIFQNFAPLLDKYWNATSSKKP